MDTGFRPDARNNRQQGHDPVSAGIIPAFRAIAPVQKEGDHHDISDQTAHGP
tara:strand:- start:1022 stop:1177 length:156 start_codon:yes stop_codon:yes gene_type:complete